MNKFFWAAAAVAVSIIASHPAFAGNAAAGKAKSKACAACHGPTGNSTSGAFPIIAGQQYDYIIQALGDYKSGKRKNPIMAPQAANLSTRDIEDLAEYFSSQTGVYYKY